MKDDSLLDPPAVTAPFPRAFQKSTQDLLLALTLIAALIPTLFIPALAQDGRKVKFSVQPQYPELAKKNNIQGTVRLQVLIATDGSIKDIKVLGGSPVLTQAAMEAVKKWRYEAAASESNAVLRFDFKP